MADSGHISSSSSSSSLSSSSSSSSSSSTSLSDDALGEFGLSAEFPIDDSPVFLAQDVDGGNRDVKALVLLDDGTVSGKPIFASASRDAIVRIWRWDPVFNT